MSPNFCEYVGHYVFKELIKLHHPLDPLPAVAVEPLIHAKTCFALCCWLCTKNVEEKAKKVNPSDPLREDILLCLLDLLDDVDENEESTEWIQLINRGSLTLVNTTFEVFVAMEYEL